MQQIDTIRVSTRETSVLEQLFKTVDGGTLTRLRNIGELWGINLSSIEPGLLGRVMSRMEEVDLDMYYCKITNIQAVALFTAIAEDNTVKILNMAGTDLSHVQPVLMARAVHKVQEVGMYNTQLTKQQVTAILRQCVEGETAMKELFLRENNTAMAGVEQGLIREAREKIVLKY